MFSSVLTYRMHSESQNITGTGLEDYGNISIPVSSTKKKKKKKG